VPNVKSTTPKKTNSPDLAGIFRQHGPAFLAAQVIPARYLKVMQQIVNCRTEVLGGHRKWCARCGFQRFLYHSCRNRHCPKCQTSAKEAWREARQLDLLPVPYFHNVFTLPHEFNSLILKSESNQRLLLKLLFDSAAQTLLEFGKTEFGGQVGFTMVLHTWDQQLRPHFHLHCLIASGALAHDRSQWIAGGNNFLFSVRALSQMFRGKFLSGIGKLLDEFQLDLIEPVSTPVKQRQFNRRLFKKPWVVYSKAPFAGPRKLLDYLSRYTHRVAIDNSRIKQCENGQVTFSYRDRRDGNHRKLLTIPASQFIGRFLRHVLPGRFMRIRHYGFMSNRNRKSNIATIRKLIGARPVSQAAEPTSIETWLAEVVAVASASCPCCGDKLIESEVTNQLVGEKRILIASARQQLRLRKRAPP
jgi:hypothetical protein